MRLTRLEAAVILGELSRHLSLLNNRQNTKYNRLLLCLFSVFEKMRLNVIVDVIKLQLSSYLNVMRLSFSYCYSSVTQLQPFIWILWLSGSCQQLHARFMQQWRGIWQQLLSWWEHTFSIFVFIQCVRKVFSGSTLKTVDDVFLNKDMKLFN